MRCECIFKRPHPQEAPVRPEDLFPDGNDSVDVNGIEVRKGSIASFIYNALALDRLDPEGEDFRQAGDEIRRLFPAMRAVRVFEVFSLRSTRVAQIVGDYL
jgi:hypothetical protein